MNLWSCAWVTGDWYILVHCSSSHEPWKVIPPYPEVNCGWKWGLRTPISPWIAVGWFKEFRSVFNRWGDVKEENRAISENPCVFWSVFDSGFASWPSPGQHCLSLPLTDVIMSYWSQSICLLRCIPGNHFPPQFVDMTHLTKPASSRCWHGSFPSVILLVLPAQRTPTYPPPRFYHRYFAVSASSQASLSLLSIHPFIFWYISE